MSEFVLELPTSGETAGEPEVAPGFEIDHAAEAVDRLVFQFQKPKFQALVRALVAGPLAELEAAIAAVYAALDVRTSTGVVLDKLGRLVGEPRRAINATDDDLYRRYILARIRTNRSRGIGNDLLTIARLIVNDDTLTIRLINHGNAALTIEVSGGLLDFTVGAALAAFLSAAAAAGVRVVSEWLMAAPAESFVFEGFIPGTEVGLGFESYDTLTGGALGSAIE